MFGLRKTKTLLVAGAVLAGLPHSARCKDKAEPEQGTSAEAVGQLKLAAPNTIKVLVLPFWDFKSLADDQHIATAGAFQLFQHQSFDMVSFQKGFDIAAADTKSEPGEAYRRDDALRMAAKVHADWVVFGEIRDLHIYEKRSFFKFEKKVECSMRISVADCRSGETIYWKAKTDTFSGQSEGSAMFLGMMGWRRTTVLNRIGTCGTAQDALDPLFQALPAHNLTGDATSEDTVQKLVLSTWPAEDAKSK